MTEAVLPDDATLLAALENILKNVCEKFVFICIFTWLELDARYFHRISS